ncbi:MAG TPA: xanthine dehydrogenase family protein subunit M [Candidatus Dormibacteraeota bacterium]
MNPFAYARPEDPEEAIALLDADTTSSAIAGGTTILDLMKAGIEVPAQLVDITPLPFHDIEDDDARGVLRIGALATMSDVARHPTIRDRFPLIELALEAGATPQLRNMATIGGNLMQRTRCDYFRDPAFAACNKRLPGSGCAARDGENRKHAVLGTSDHCIATHPSDLAVALVALDARIHLQGPDGARTIPVEDFHLLPGATPHRETAIRRGELIRSVEILAPPHAARAVYRKVRDRASYEFALVAVAALLTIEDDRIATARVALGGVATKPWRSREAEAALTGAPPTHATFEAAATAALRDAHPRTHNAYKVDLARRTIALALTEATRP